MFRRLTFFLTAPSCAGIIALSACAGVTGALGAIELAAYPEQYVGEGIIYHRLVFKDDTRRLEMELPAGWRHRNDGPARLVLIPPGNGFAEGVIETQPLPPAAAFDEAAQRALEQHALATIRPDSQAIALVDPKHVSTALQAYPNAEAVVSYKALGYTFRRSIVLMNLRESRLTVRFTAPEAEFNALNKAFRGAVASCDWQ